MILIPVAAIGALVLAAWPRLFARHGLWIALVTVVALGATNLTIGAGHALRNDLNLQGNALVAQHASAADKLRILLILFTALLLIAVAVFRTAGPRVTGIGPLDAALTAVRSGVAPGTALRVTVAVFAIASLYYVFHTGDLGARRSGSTAWAVAEVLSFRVAARAACSRAAVLRPRAANGPRGRLSPGVRAMGP